MRTSKLFFKTFKEAPHEADVISHQLLERGGYLMKISKGIYIYTPLMQRVIKKISAIVREELDLAGAQEISMPFLHPAELWQQTGRWEDFVSANLLYTLKDREDHPFCLAPTHEEVVVAFASHWTSSYKQLPFNLYQIGTKFRDEIRPRFGLMRCKEFLMKDGYSFSRNPEEMEEQYQIMRRAYSKIFKRLELDFFIVEAHGGKIGKGKSEEFQVKAAIGEDAIMVAGNYASNIEMAKSIPPTFNYDAHLKEKEQISTPGATTIEKLCGHLKVYPQEILKTLVYKVTFPGKEEYVSIGIRGDRQINEIKVTEKLGALEITLANDENLKRVTGVKAGFIGPLNSSLPFYADNSCKPMKNFVCAGNVEDIHHIHVNWERDIPLPEFDDFLLAEEGDECPNAPNERYKLQRGIEVGHIFNLGTRYTEKLKAQFQDETGEIQPLWMGTYGIGVGRTAAACVEQRHDRSGIIWPVAIAPFKILITSAQSNDKEQSEMAEKIYQELEALNYEPLLDDREERLGFKLKDSDLIGIPFKMICGKTLKEGKIEIESRLGKKEIVALDQVVSWCKDNIVD